MSLFVLAARLSARGLPTPRSRILPPIREGCSAGRRQSRGRATQANVATRSRFGRGARHRTIPLREPPASGALRLPALHRGFFAQAAGPPRLEKPHSLHPSYLPTASFRARFDSQPYVTEARTNVRVMSLETRRSVGAGLKPAPTPRRRAATRLGLPARNW
jgi:hypothetical protein